MTGRMSSTVLLGDSAAGPGDVLSTHIYRPNEASKSDEEELRSKLHAAWIAKGRIAGSTAGCGVEALALPHSCTPLCNQLRGDMKSEPQFWHLAEACTIPTSDHAKEYGFHKIGQCSRCKMDLLSPLLGIPKDWSNSKGLQKAWLSLSRKWYVCMCSRVHPEDATKRQYMCKSCLIKGHHMPGKGWFELSHFGEGKPLGKQGQPKLSCQTTVRSCKGGHLFPAGR